MSKLAQYNEQTANIHGWFNEVATVIWDCLFSYQEENSVTGNLMEIGVHKGKSAALSALYARPDEQFYFLDTFMDEATREFITGINQGNSHIIIGKSEDLPLREDYADLTRTMRWVHIDGDHNGGGFYNDLKIADDLLGPQGIVALDDFFAASYPQITQALFRYLENNPYSFSLFLVGYNKGYLVRPKYLPVMTKYIRDHLADEFKARGLSDFTIWKTGFPADINCFGVTHRVKDLDYKGTDAADGMNREILI